MELNVIKGEGAGKPRPCNNRDAAALVCLWQQKVVQMNLVSRMAELTPPEQRVKYSIMGSVFQAQASRLLGRLVSLNVGLLPTIPELGSDDLVKLRETLVHSLQYSIQKQSNLSDVLRRAGDIATCWVLDLNAADDSDYLTKLRQTSSEPKEAASK